MFRNGDEAPDRQTLWSQDQLLALAKSPEGREALVPVLLELLRSDERVKEAVMAIAHAEAVKVSGTHRNGQPVLGGYDAGAHADAVLGTRGES